MLPTRIALMQALTTSFVPAAGPHPCQYAHPGRSCAAKKAVVGMSAATVAQADGFCKCLHDPGLLQLLLCWRIHCGAAPATGDGANSSALRVRLAAVTAATAACVRTWLLVTRLLQAWITVQQAHWVHAQACGNGLCRDGGGGESGAGGQGGHLMLLAAASAPGMDALCMLQAWDRCIQAANKQASGS